MEFYNHAIGSDLSKYIDAVMYYKDFMPDHSIERLVPTGHVYIVFELDGYPRNTFDNETLQPLQTFKKVWVSGMHRNYISISAHQKSEMLIIQFRAYGAYPFFYIPIEEFNDQIVSAEVLFGESILHLREDILMCDTPEQKFAAVDAWLLSRLRTSYDVPADILHILEHLQKQPASQYRQIIERYPKTQKHLIAQFKKYIGLTPKYYQRILRFNEVMQEIHKSKKIEWSQIAYQCNYADQSHFIKEFKHFSGFNPQQFIQQNFEEEQSNFFPLDREG